MHAFTARLLLACMDASAQMASRHVSRSHAPPQEFARRTASSLEEFCYTCLGKTVHDYIFGPEYFDHHVYDCSTHIT